MKIINKASLNNSIYISAVSVWEIGMLEAKKRIILNCPILDWITNAINAPGVNLLELEPHIAIESCNLHNFRGDPADRIIISTARNHGLTLITKDKQILQYGKKHKVIVTEP